MSKVVLITGGSSGIGKSVGEFLTKKGFVVYGTSRNPINIKNHPFKLVALDVRNIETINAAVLEVIKNEGRLDVLVNNAGMGITGPIEETPTDEMRKVFDTNLFGAVDVMKAVLPQMRKQESGLIINVTSIAGYMGLPFRGIYSATKGALEIVTEAIRMEVKNFGIEVTNVAPGDFATNIASGRYHTPVIEDSPYKQKYQENLNLMDAHVNGGSDPIEMAEAIFKIINTGKPKVHYKVGDFMQKFSIVLKKILPSKMYEKLIMNHYKM
ncbi:SDR family oxidoreductase [Lutibacter citreus]|uniref:SDR family oxidoreductase n=1 Tax=Lutibacter citreus TaxID=2138210 RepID=UPI000DBE5F97|nr:SDR family oxidoreductase [Lutibacter citreus]